MSNDISGSDGHMMRYHMMFAHVSNLLAEHDAEAATSVDVPFRKRSEHIWRVFQWARRLLDDGYYADVDRDAVLTATLFHDAGYATAAENAPHAEYSALAYERYASTYGVCTARRAHISYLISNHSRKNLMDDEATPRALIALIEADLLDETGALSIIWDCMMEGSQCGQSFIKTYEHIMAYSHTIVENNPMKSPAAQGYWQQKQALVEVFVNQLACDLAIGEGACSIRGPL